jgi:glycosyltransferase involved in cell wall biosynthesis
MTPLAQGAARPPATVAYVLPRLEMGGTEKHVRDLAEALERKRYRPIVIATSDGGILEAEFARMGIPVFVLEYKGLSRRRRKALPLLRQAISFLRAMVRILREENVAIVHAYLPAANVIGTITALLARTPRIIVSKRGLCHYKKDRPILAILESAANLAADVVMVNSEAVASAVQAAERFCSRKIHRIYNGIEAAAPAYDGSAASLSVSQPSLGPPLPADAVKILQVGNFFPYKGHVDLVEAASTVVEGVTRAHFLLAGREEGTGEEVKRRIEALGLADRVHILGPRNDIPALMRAADLVVHPSHEEGFPNTILEAMAAGKAVVATNVGGIPEAVMDGETGILVPPRRPDRLAEALLALLNDPERAARMGKAGRRRVVDAFPLGKMVREVEEMYDRLLEGGALRCAG